MVTSVLASLLPLPPPLTSFSSSFSSSSLSSRRRSPLTSSTRQAGCPPAVRAEARAEAGVSRRAAVTALTGVVAAWAAASLTAKAARADSAAAGDASGILRALPRLSSRSNPNVPARYRTDALALVDALRVTIRAEADGASELQVRKQAEGAKELVRTFVSRWRDSPLVSAEESCKQLSSAVQQLGKFYSTNGPRTKLSAEVRAGVLAALDAAEDAL